jgi:DnaJ-class molecular chaperone
MTYYNPDQPKTNCFTCDGSGIVYEGEHFPSDPNNPCVHAETCPDCMGSGYVTKE